MSTLNIAATLLCIAAIFSYLNYRFVRLPTTIGIMLIALTVSLALIAIDHFGPDVAGLYARPLLHSIDFDKTLMHGMLSFLLFAGALHIHLDDLLDKKWIVASLASFGVILSTAIVGISSWYILNFMGIEIPLIYALVFGALISPTDPVAVIGILKTAGASRSLETKIAGESLFNDGVAVVIFIALLNIATGTGHASPEHIALLFVEEAIGGALFGLAIGWITYLMLKSVDNYQVEVLLTLALVMGGYAMASSLHLSGPIAIVMAGLLIGNQGRRMAMSDQTRKNLDMFWELLDEILNAVLFVLIGLEVLVLTFKTEYLVAGVVLALVVLLARFISVGMPISLFRLRTSFHPHVVKLLTWSGLRGGISVALALSLPEGPARDTIVAITYVIVIVSIVTQGLTVRRLVEFASRSRLSVPKH
ncbi:MAG: cation:proton antiporter [bacterium]